MGHFGVLGTPVQKWTKLAKRGPKTALEDLQPLPLGLDPFLAIFGIFRDPVIPTFWDLVPKSYATVRGFRQKGVKKGSKNGPVLDPLFGPPDPFWPEWPGPPIEPHLK